jgi:predicted ester cyclase
VSTPSLVAAFYERIWNRGDLDAVDELVSEEFAFRGSLGIELRSRAALKGYVCAVRNTLADYHCEILECVSESQRAFAKVHFAGIHVGTFRGYAPTGKRLHWLGAALFRIERLFIAELWVLGDLASLDDLLRANA